ncbi:hypothetical protein [Thioalkalivibrio sp. ALE23]|uniref:hypothetical protein n=1 Tax=Thioalkalivibrio sp. ALE23 TaxID=1265495 RepID=UPI0003A87AD9|nr:hypothetical protein [Thioalkalivibrio sp. ALE23]
MTEEKHFESICETEEFDPLMFEEYVSTHGFGDVTEEGMRRGRELVENGTPYSTAAHEIVIRGMTEDFEEDEGWPEVKSLQDAD